MEDTQTRRRAGDGGPQRLIAVVPVAVANILIARRRLVLSVVALAVLVGAARLLLHETRYTAESSFMSESQRPSGQLRGIAAQLGLLDAGGGTTMSPQHYAAVLESRRLLEQVVTDTFELAAVGEWPAVHGTLAELYGVEGTTERQRIRIAMGVLRNSLDLEPESGTSILRLETAAPRPDLAVELNRRLLRLVDEFNVRQRQSTAGEQRRFIEGRMEEARLELRQAEQALQEYMEANRSWDQSPRHQFEVRRLERQVSLQQELYTALAKSHDQARIEEVRNTALITVLDEPENSVEADDPNPFLTLLVAAILGFLLGSVVALAWHLVAEGERERPEEYAELRRSVGRIRGRLVPSGRSRQRVRTATDEP